MKKDSYKRIDAFRRIEDSDFVEKQLDFNDVEESKSPSDSLLKLVYERDERTGLPMGDLQYLVSDKANPQVKEFILQNLMQDVSSAKNVVAKFDLSDDDILALSRNPNESVQDYAARLNSSIERDRWILNQYKTDVQSKSESSSVSVE